MKGNNASKSPLRMATYLDGLLFWSVFASASILMLWLLTSTTKNLLRQSVATRIVTLSNMTAASLSPKLYTQQIHQPSLQFSDIPSEHLQAIQDKNPDINGLVVAAVTPAGLKVLGHTKVSPGIEKLFQKKAEDPEFQKLVRQAQLNSLPVFSSWNFLTTRDLPLFVERVKEPEYTFTAIPNWVGFRSEDIPVIILIFNAPLLQQQFLQIDDNSAAVIAVAVLVATILSWVVQRRSTQRQQAVEEKLAAVNLLKQRDAILGRVAATMDEVLTDKNFEHAIIKLLHDIGRELQLRSCYVCLASGPRPILGNPGAGDSQLVFWKDLQAGKFQQYYSSLIEGRAVVLSLNEVSTSEADFFKELNITALALIPILFEKHLLGAMVLMDQEPVRNWDPGLLDSLKLAADLYGAAHGRREQDDKLLESGKIQALGRMAGGVAHEFNNLLHIISGNLERLLRRPECQPDEKELLKKILEAGGRGSRIVEQLLSATRQSRSDITSTSLNELVQKTVSLFQPVAKRDVQLKLQLDADLPNALLDVSKIQQVMLNLLINANDAISHQGEIELITSRRNHDVEGATRAFVCCEVRDNGKGIELQDLEHIFDPFFTTKDPGHGTGLGLSTSRGILSQHGGFIEGHNREQGGASFTFYLPIDSNPGKKALFTKTGKLAVAAPSGSKGRVLMADDEALCREVMAAILEERGYSFLMAADGEELLKLAAATEADVRWIITDWTMPGRHGAELITELRRLLPSAYLIVTSGFALSSQDVPGVDALIQKPFGPRELFKVMDELEAQVQA